VWGRIAAVNALSDIYAMGGQPLTALQYLAWPRDDLSFDLAAAVVAGGMDVMSEAGCTVVGGHSIDGPEPHYGFAVTGVIDEGNVVTNGGGSDGDLLILTKPLGVGIITTAIKRGACPPALERLAIDVMSRTNRKAGETMVGRASAATDVTGFGLLGHLGEMCAASGTGAEIHFGEVPVIAGVTELLAQGMWPGGSKRNLDAMLPIVDSHLQVEQLKLLVDAQTSGGLLIAMSEGRVDGFLSDLDDDDARVIGRLTSGKTIRVA
ncbi:MAG: selenide, water dikinase SelD, partial [Acidimicrobiia bacterium]